MAAAITAAETPAGDPHARTSALIAQHGPMLLKVARRVSLCADDAHDALQRALEIYLRRLETIDPRTEGAWMRVVVRNEALAVRKQRSQIVASEDVDFDSHVDDSQRPLHERMESAERVSRSGEALRGLKPDEARALLLKAEGLSYHEIGEQLDWSYTKVNRCITEGRARFRKLFGGIESGEQCERFGPLLLALAEGTAGADEMVALKPHLRHCVACRAEVRRLHGARRPLAAFLPFPALLERLRPTQIKADFYALFGRIGSSEPVAQTLAAGGGGRSGAATALVGICLAGASAGGYCALGGPLPGEAAARDADSKAGRRVDEPKLASAAARPAVAVAPTPSRAAHTTPVRVRVASSGPARRGPARRVKRDSTEQGTGEFSFERSGASAATPAFTYSPPASEAVTTSRQPAAGGAAPAPAPSTGDAEFGFER